MREPLWTLARKRPSGNRVNGLGVEFDPLALGLVDPDTKAELGQKLGPFAMRLKARTRLGVDHICFTALDVFHGRQVEVVGVGNFAHKLTGLFAVFFFLLQALRPLLARFRSCACR